jgi:hypothetical protein
MTWNEGSDGSLTFDSPSFRADRFYVYIAWGENHERPLYVGKGNRPFTRIGLHLALTKWAGEVRSFECHAFLTPEAALEAEIEAIYELNPIYNVRRTQPSWITAQNIVAAVERQQADVHSERRAAMREKYVRPAREPKERIPSPWKRPGKRRRVITMPEEWWTPEQAAIVARIQKAGRP